MDDQYLSRKKLRYFSPEKKESRDFFLFFTSSRSPFDLQFRLESLDLGLKLIHVSLNVLVHNSLVLDHFGALSKPKGTQGLLVTKG